MAGVRELLQKVKMEKRARESGRPDNEQIHTKRATGYQAINTVASVASLVGSLTEISPLFGELPRLPNPDRSSSNTPASLGGRLLNELDDRYDDKNKENFINKILAGKIEAGKDHIENKNIYKKFFSDKTLQKTNMFICNFTEFNGVWHDIDVAEPAVRTSIKLEPHHFKSVNFKVLPSDVRVEVAGGSFPFPVIDAEDIVFEFSVVFEEDSYGTVLNFIQSSYARIAGYDWINNDRKDQSIGSFSVTSINEQFNVLTDVIFEDVFIVSAGDMAFDYSDVAGTRDYSVTFRATSRTIRTLKVKVKDIELAKAEASANPKDTGATNQETE